MYTPQYQYGSQFKTVTYDAVATMSRFLQVSADNSRVRSLAESTFRSYNTPGPTANDCWKWSIFCALLGVGLLIGYGVSSDGSDAKDVLLILGLISLGTSVFAIASYCLCRIPSPAEVAAATARREAEDRENARRSMADYERQQRQQIERSLAEWKLEEV